MMSDKEAESGMTREQATARGLKFGQDNIFSSDGGKDLGKFEQGCSYFARRNSMEK